MTAVPEMIEVAERALVEAADIFMAGWGHEPSARLKTERDPVSEIDLRIETRLKDLLQSHTGPGTFLGEETGGVIPIGACAGFWTRSKEP